MNILKLISSQILLSGLFVLSRCMKKGDYELNLLDDYSVNITIANAVMRIFKPDFMVLINDKDPNKMLRRGDFGYVMSRGTGQGFLYNVPTWGKPDNFVLGPKVHVEDGFNPEFDRTYGKGRTANYFMASPGVKILAIKAENKGDSFTWYFEEQEKRFSNMPFLSESFRSSIPGTLVAVDGVTTSIIADPKYIPLGAVTPNSDNSQFGVMVRNDKGNAQSIVFVPVLGNADSKMISEKPFIFDVYLFQKKSPLIDAFEYIAYNVCDFSDIRSNSSCNLNTTIENMLAYVQSPYPMFIDLLKGFNYLTDIPGAVKNISGLHPFEIAILTDDENLFRRMARPMLEYGLSHEHFLFSPNDKVKGQGTSSKLNEPGVPFSDLTTAYTYSGNRIDYFLDNATEPYDKKVVRSLNLDFINYEDYWLNSLSFFRTTSDQKCINQVIIGCDAYLKDRIERTQTDFVDKYNLGWFFWTSFTNQWMELLQVYQSTVDQSVTIVFAPEKSFIDLSREYFVKMWKQNKPFVNDVIKDGKIAVSLKAKEVTAMTIEGVGLCAKFQKKIFSSSEKWSNNYATLHYAIDGQWEQKEKFSYPNEYTIELPKTAEKFEYWFESETPTRSVVKSKIGELVK